MINTQHVNNEHSMIYLNAAKRHLSDAFAYATQDCKIDIEVFYPI